MVAQVIRQDRLGDPRDAFRIEEIDTPPIGPDEVLVAVMAAGINYNNVWAAQGIPIDVIAVRQRGGDAADYHVGGSDASGIVYAVGAEVSEVAVGDEVIIHHGWWDRDDPWVLAGPRPDDRAVGARSGATRPTTARSASSPSRRPTSACRSRRT